MELYSILGKVLYIREQAWESLLYVRYRENSKLLVYQYAHDRDRIVLSTTSREDSLQNIDFFERI